MRRHPDRVETRADVSAYMSRRILLLRGRDGLWWNPWIKMRICSKHNGEIVGYSEVRLMRYDSIIWRLPQNGWWYHDNCLNGCLVSRKKMTSLWVLEFQILEQLHSCWVFMESVCGKTACALGPSPWTALDMLAPCAKRGSWLSSQFTPLALGGLSSRFISTVVSWLLGGFKYCSILLSTFSA